jgi:ferredoxin-like protein FixX
MTYKHNGNPKKPSNNVETKTKNHLNRLLKLESLNELSISKYVKLDNELSHKHISSLGHTSFNMTESYIKACPVGNSSEIDKSNILCKLKSLQCHECHPFNNSYPISASQFRHELSTLYFRLKVLEEKKIK